MKLNGWKTYLLALALLCYAAGGYASGNIDAAQAATAIKEALALAFIRHGINKVGNNK